MKKLKAARDRKSKAGNRVEGPKTRLTRLEIRLKEHKTPEAAAEIDRPKRPWSLQSAFGGRTP